MNFASTTLKKKLQKAHEDNLQGLTNTLAACFTLALFAAIFTGVFCDFQISKMLEGLLFAGVLFVASIALFIMKSSAQNKFSKRLEMYKDLINQGYVANQCYTWKRKKHASVHFRKADPTSPDQDIAVNMPFNESMIIMRSIRNSIVNNIPSQMSSISPVPPVPSAALTYTALTYAAEPLTYTPAPTTYYPAPTSYYATPSTPQPVPTGYQHDATAYQPSPTTIQLAQAKTYHPVVTRYAKLPSLK